MTCVMVDKRLGDKDRREFVRLKWGLAGKACLLAGRREEMLRRHLPEVQEHRVAFRDEAGITGTEGDKTPG